MLTGLVAACLIGLLFYVAADSVLAVTRANPVDFDATALRLWRAGLLLSAPVFAIVLYVGLRWAEPHFAARPRRGSGRCRGGGHAAAAARLRRALPSKLVPRDPYLKIWACFRTFRTSQTFRTFLGVFECL